MPLDETDSAYLWDMLQACQAVLRFVAGISRDDYLHNEVVQAAVERKLEIVGEAARRVSADLQRSSSEIPWSKIRGQRHVLAHDYGRIEHDRLWVVVTQDLPKLIAQIEHLMHQTE